MMMFQFASQLFALNVPRVVLTMGLMTLTLVQLTRACEYCMHPETDPCSLTYKVFCKMGNGNICEACPIFFTCEYGQQTQKFQEKVAKICDCGRYPHVLKGTYRRRRLLPSSSMR